MWFQNVFFLFSLTLQVDAGLFAFRGVSAPNIFPFTACVSPGETAKDGQNDFGKAAIYPAQANLPTSTKMAKLPPKTVHLEPENRTHERLGTLKNALRGPPPSAWSITGYRSTVYGRYELGSPVAPNGGVYEIRGELHGRQLKYGGSAKDIDTRLASPKHPARQLLDEGENVTITKKHVDVTDAASNRQTQQIYRTNEQLSLDEMAAEPGESLNRIRARAAKKFESDLLKYGDRRKTIQ